MHQEGAKVVIANQKENLDVYSMQKITPITMGIVGGVLIALGAFVIYVEHRIKEPEEKVEEYLREAEEALDRRANPSKYDADRKFAPTLDSIKEGGKTKRTKTKRKTKRK